MPDDSAARTDPYAGLAADVKAGKPGSFDKLFREFFPMVMSMARGWFRSEPDAEDAAIQTFTDVARGIAQFEGRSKLSTWVYKVALRRMAYNLRRLQRGGRMVSLEMAAGVASPAPTPEEAHEVRMMNQDLLAGIMNLPVEESRAVVLRHVAGLDNDEAAAVLGVSEATFRQRLSRGLRRLREDLEEGPRSRSQKSDVRS